MTAQRTHRACDIAIVGGSLVGLSLGRALALALGPEVRVTILERRPIEATPDADPRAYAISAGSRRLLGALGAWAKLEAHAQVVHAIDITDSALEHAIRPVLLSYDNTLGAGEPASWIVEGTHLRATLTALACGTPGLEVCAPAEMRATHIGEAGAEIVLDGGECIRCGLLIACDGGRSPVREAAGIKVVRWSQPQVGIVTTVELERPHEARAVQHFLPGGPFAILPLRGNRACITWTEDKERGHTILGLGDEAFLAEVQRRFGHKLGSLALVGPRAAWPLEFHLARALTGRRLALAGDAARSVHPLAGQGLNLGLRDVAALTQCVAEAMRLGLDPGDWTALERYQRWRRFDSVQSAAAFEALNQLFSNDVGLVRAARDVGLGLVDRSALLKQALVREAAGLSGEVPRLLRGEMA
jgi:2-octaprenyl-6-methoxyphenol hydroxylase